MLYVWDIVKYTSSVDSKDSSNFALSKYKFIVKDLRRFDNIFL